MLFVCSRHFVQHNQQILFLCLLHLKNIWINIKKLLKIQSKLLAVPNPEPLIVTKVPFVPDVGDSDVTLGDRAES